MENKKIYIYNNSFLIFLTFFYLLQMTVKCLTLNMQIYRNVDSAICVCVILVLFFLFIESYRLNISLFNKCREHKQRENLLRIGFKNEYMNKIPFVEDLIDYVEKQSLEYEDIMYILIKIKRIRFNVLLYMISQFAWLIFMEIILG